MAIAPILPSLDELTEITNMHENAKRAAISKLAEQLRPFHESITWTWDRKEGTHYEGNRVDPAGIWLIRRRDPHSKSPGTTRTLAEDFDFVATNRFLLVIEAFLELNRAMSGGHNVWQKRRRADIIAAVREEIEVVKRSFERANNHPFRLHLTDDVRLTDYDYELECKAAKLFFQLDQLRNCTKQDSRAYTIEQLQTIYSILLRLLDHFVWNIEGKFNPAVKGKLVGPP